MGDNYLPAEALFVNGIPIEREIKGYRTLGVSGRELMNNNLIITERQVGDGDFMIHKKYPSRYITVDYLLAVDNSEQFRKSYNELNKILGGTIKEFRFNDELRYSYYGYLNTAEEVPKGVNFIRSSFTLYFPDPFKYADEVNVRGSEAVFAVNSPYKTLPSSIEVLLEADSDTITLVNGDKKITLKQLGLVKGKKVIFDFNELTIKQGGNSLLSKLSLNSDFENFYVEDGEPIKVMEPSIITVRYREAIL